ncbi:DinB family protein [Streptomyces sp. NPDC091272]|uniref:DinB family protein n=1 Tax=Streptomyces sp. NPDC091272 TaxID=3365981 RepID=UPI0037FF1CBA
MTDNEQAPLHSAATTTPAVSRERADLLEVLAKQRHFLRLTTQNLTDEQARLRPTASELCLGGLIKHVTEVERNWCRFILEGPSAMGDFNKMTDEDWAARANGFLLLPDETLEGVLAEYEKVAAQTDELVVSLPDLNAEHALPPAPWNEPGKHWSARQVLMHVATETAQHAGHADIIRETVDGQKSMG